MNLTKTILIILLTLNISLDANNDRALKMMKAEQRVALVIGNNQYSSDRLPYLRNPINDAKAMRSKLQTLGFTVYYGENLSVRGMDKKLRSFSSSLSKGGVGLFFFAGHGVESQGKNYLMGKDSALVTKSDIAYESLELNKVIDTMKNSGNRLNIVLLDACRNDPFSRSGGGGLAKVDNARGMFIAYATSPGDVASDGSGKHGVFTQEILNNIDAQGVSIHNVFKNVKRDVYSKTNQRQRPWTHDDIIGSFFFRLPSENSNAYKVKSSYDFKNLKQKAPTDVRPLTYQEKQFQQTKKTLKELKTHLKNNDTESISTIVHYPHSRYRPFVDIQNKKEFIEQFGYIFDEHLKNIILSASEKDLHVLGYKGVLLKNGIMWFQDGKIKQINYQSKKEKDLVKELKILDQNYIHPSIKTYDSKYFVLATKKFKIRIDKLKDSTFRYVAWGSDQDQSDKPNIINQQPRGKPFS
ncbi:MAG: caspase family protein [Sulfurimonas sp.]|nr:caspase family protein [Sulfurimonas sp.]